MKEVKIENQWIGGDNPVYIVAEIGGNFRDFQTAVKLIDLARKAGVNAVKFQHYRADTITSKKAIFEMDNTGVVSQYDIFKKYELSEELTADIFSYCRENKITAFSTPSHPTDVDLLEKFDVPAYKIGSDDAVNIPFLKYVAKIGKPILLSTGMCTMSEVQRSVDAILEEGNDQIILFHCTTNYPTHFESVNLRAMQSMQSSFNFPVGYSDHTLGIDICYAASVLGASTVEFHFTYDKNAEGPDHMLSKDYEETEALVEKVRKLPLLLGDGIKRPAATEMNTRRNNRKSLVLTRNIKAGEKITTKNMDIKRPGYGISSEYYYNVLGKTVIQNIDADNVLSWEDIAS
ncbi:MAG: N-acetylneuraminate synthase family protein [Desulfobacula sp.]|nr:N-acetylneuraminate synthase family protein [Desulfobacula sp.]